MGGVDLSMLKNISIFFRVSPKGNLFSCVLILILLYFATPKIYAGEIVNPSPDSDKWQALKKSLFNKKKIINNANKILAIEAPFRAEDAAVVPISIKSNFPQTSKKYIRKIFVSSVTTVLYDVLLHGVLEAPNLFI